MKGLILGTVAIFLLGVGLALWLSAGRQTIKVPGAIVQAAKSPIYLPEKLPGNYKLNESSFSIQEDDIVMFWAEDGAGGRIIFTQQARPQDFDFDSFYNERLKEPETVESVPFSSVVGKTYDQALMISIVTPESWIIATTRSPLSADDLKLAAQHITKYPQ